MPTLPTLHSLCDALFALSGCAVVSLCGCADLRMCACADVRMLPLSIRQNDSAHQAMAVYRGATTTLRLAAEGCEPLEVETTAGPGATRRECTLFTSGDIWSWWSS